VPGNLVAVYQGLIQLSGANSRFLTWKLVRQQEGPI